MKLKSLKLRNFRTYENLNISFHNKFNLFYGNNAQGKTNLLEAVYYICSFRSFKSAKNEELITFGQENAGVKGEIVSKHGFDEINIHINRSKKNIKLNGKVVYKLSSHLGRFGVVLFVPKDLEIVRGSPGVRRRYIDALVCNLNADHVNDLKSYNKIISHRNKILASPKNINSNMLEVLDAKTAETGASLTARRLKIINDLTKRLGELYNSTSGVSAKIDIAYKTSYERDRDIQGSILKSLKKNFNKDRAKGHTTAGPHRDYVGLRIDGNDTTVYASQGESKNFVLALKAAEINIYESTKGQKPILLLDDITSELDRSRKSFLFQLLRNYDGQVFVTSTGADEIPYKGDKKVFRVTKGKAQEV